MQVNPYTHEVIWPPRYKPLPPGYSVCQMDSGHYFWAHRDGEEGSAHWDAYWCRRGAFLHAAKAEAECYPECDERDEGCKACPAYDTPEGTR